MEASVILRIVFQVRKENFAAIGFGGELWRQGCGVAKILLDQVAYGAGGVEEGLC